MNILLVITGLKTGGAETQLCSLADAFATLGHRVKIVSLNSLIEIKPKNSDVSLENLSFNSKGFFSLFLAMYKFFKIYHCFRPDIVHSHMFHANIFCRLSKLFGCRAKLVCSAHSQNEGGGGRTLAYRLTDALCTITTNVSDVAVNDYIRKKCVPDRSRILTMHNGIDIYKYKYDPDARSTIRHELSISDDVVMFLAVGRLTEAKDYPSLINSYSNFISDDICKSKLLIIGDGCLRHEIELLIDSLGLHDFVCLLGTKDNVSEYMSACDFFVISSKWEGFPSVVGEAMACSRLVVATTAGGTAEWFSGLDYAFLSSCGCSDELAVNLRQAYSLNAHEVKKIESMLREQIESKFSIFNVARKWLDLYNRS